MLNRPVKPVPTAHAEINEIHANMYDALDTAIVYINELEETIANLTKRIEVLEGNDTTDSEI